jgi:hypothetical protein
VFPENRDVPLGGRTFSVWMKASVPMDVTVIVHHKDYAEHFSHTFHVGMTYDLYEFDYVTTSTRINEMDFVTSSAGDLWIDEVWNSSSSKYLASPPTRQSYEVATGSRLWNYYQETEGTTWWKYGGQWFSGNNQPDEILVTPQEELGPLGFNGDFDGDLHGWVAAGTPGAAVFRDPTTFLAGSASLKLVHEGGGPSEADNSATAFPNGAGAKRITIWMKASNAENVDVYLFSGEADADWDHQILTTVSVTTAWAPYVIDHIQVGSKFTAIDFDQKDVNGALPGTALWVDSIDLRSTEGVTEVYRGGYEYRVSPAKATELEAVGFTIRTET